MVNLYPADLSPRTSTVSGLYNLLQEERLVQVCTNNYSTTGLMTCVKSVDHRGAVKLFS